MNGLGSLAETDFHNMARQETAHCLGSSKYNSREPQFTLVDSTWNTGEGAYCKSENLTETVTIIEPFIQLKAVESQSRLLGAGAKSCTWRFHARVYFRSQRRRCRATSRVEVAPFNVHRRASRAKLFAPFHTTFRELPGSIVCRGVIVRRRS